MVQDTQANQYAMPRLRVPRYGNATAQWHCAHYEHQQQQEQQGNYYPAEQPHLHKTYLQHTQMQTLSLAQLHATEYSLNFEEGAEMQVAGLTRQVIDSDIYQPAYVVHPAPSCFLLILHISHQPPASALPHQQQQHHHPCTQVRWV